MADKEELTIRPGLHTVKELFDLAGFDFEKHATVDYGDGEFLDHRLVRVGGLSFDSLSRVVDIPASADTVDIEVEGTAKKSFKVDSSAKRRNVTELPEDATHENITF